MRWASLLFLCVSLAGQTVPPRPRFTVDAPYTLKAYLKHKEGLVVLSCTVGADGIPRNISVERSLDKGLDKRAAKALSKWVFYPGTKNGMPTEMKATVDFSFK